MGAAAASEQAPEEERQSLQPRQPVPVHVETVKPAPLGGPSLGATLPPNLAAREGSRKENLPPHRGGQPLPQSPGQAPFPQSVPGGGAMAEASRSLPARTYSPPPQRYVQHGAGSRQSSYSPPPRFTQSGVHSPANSFSPLPVQQFRQAPTASFSPAPSAVYCQGSPAQRSLTGAQTPPVSTQYAAGSGRSPPPTYARPPAQQPMQGSSTPLMGGGLPPLSTAFDSPEQNRSMYLQSGSPPLLPIQPHSNGSPAPWTPAARSDEDLYGDAKRAKAMSALGQRSPEGRACGPEARDRDTRRAKEEKDTVCGMDKRPLLPMGLVTTLILGAICLITLHRGLVEAEVGEEAGLLLTVAGCFLYAATFGSMGLAAYIDPGQLDDQAFQKWLDGQLPLPKRAHKTWHCERPVLRFDHYCRWIKNCIGLRNHREFLLMTTGCVAIALMGTLVDGLLIGRVLYLAWADGQPEALLENWPVRACIVVHFIYSVIFWHYSWPILKLHVGFVSRNELAKEWRQDRYYVVVDPDTGTETSVQDLDPESYNEHFENFQYDSNRNPFDKGWQKNCWAFWCTPRWAPGQLGEF